MTWTFIAGMDAPVSDVFAFTGLSLAGYKQLQVVASGIVVTTDATDIVLTLYTGAAEVTSGYRWGEYHHSSAASSGNTADASDPSIVLTSVTANWDVGNAAGECYGTVIWIDQPASTALYKRVWYEGAHVGPTGVVVAQSGTGVMENTGALDGLKIAGSSAFTAGKVRLLGLA